mgnify:CR=1 FL=1
MVRVDQVHRSQAMIGLHERVKHVAHRGVVRVQLHLARQVEEEVRAGPDARPDQSNDVVEVVLNVLHAVHEAAVRSQAQLVYDRGQIDHLLAHIEQRVVRESYVSVISLGGAVVAAQVCTPGVYGVMNGRVIEADELEKNRTTGRFA